MKISMLISIFFFMSLHPLTMLIMLILMTLNIITIVYLSTNTTWIPMILILLILGGMLVLFIYITSVTPNKKFSFKKQSIFMVMPSLMFSTNMVYLNFSQTSILLFNMDKNSFLLIFITIYLLITLIAIMKLINSSTAPLRLSN
uniref:NADH dehydrogenase subunit 6 n=1 Tax=Argas africolumbae TaxID=1210872 RepID=K7QM70_ARGAF|nr:NADH dehydrogenase subunit 6 [Argas africolumbae]AFV32075.1 NADH dehydrogenase subunit 6 [Argas africolumbae]UYL27194.1 NADH dehydrogenase subunit 6 [Argas africolumbae]